MTEILKWPDPRLQIVCDPYTFDNPSNVPGSKGREDHIGDVHFVHYADLWDLLDEMWANMKQFMAYGLAAPQLGSPTRVICVHVPGGCKVELINPIVQRCWGGKFISDEGCLSYPGKRVRVMRYRQIKVSGMDRHGNPIAFGGKNVQAAALQHELDHLNGINLADYRQGSTTKVNQA